MSDRMWRLRPEEYLILEKAKEILRQNGHRHVGAARSVEFLAALLKAQDEVDQCPPKSRYGWSSDPTTDAELQAKYGDSEHKPKE